MSKNSGRAVNLKRGFRRITFLLGVLLAIVCAVYAGNIPVQKRAYYSQFLSARSPRLVPIVKRPSEQELSEFQEWQKEKGVNVGPDMYSISDEKVYRLDDQTLNQTLKDFRPHFLKAIYWQNLSRPGIVGIVMVYALGGAAAGFSATWFMVWFGGL